MVETLAISLNNGNVLNYNSSVGNYEFLNIISKLDIQGLEPLLEEIELKDGILTEENLFTDKYFLLSALRDCFNHMISQGEKELEFYHSMCGRCNPKDKVSVFYGNKTGLHFGIVPAKSDEGLYSFHFCWGYSDLNGNPVQQIPMIDFVGFKYLEFKERGLI